MSDYGAGVISHPNEYSFSGYHEIRKPKEKYRLIDHEQLLKLSNKCSMAYLIEKIDNERYSRVVEDVLAKFAKKYGQVSQSLGKERKLWDKHNVFWFGVYSL